MAKKEETTNSNINTNTNNVNVKVDVKVPKRTYTKKKTNHNWLGKAIIGAIITIVGALIANYYIDNNQNHNPPGTSDKSNAISGVKQ